jgi:RimJ/RimL family protein N-acetyltransferase
VRRGALAAVVVYHDWHPDYETAQMSIASVTPRWASRAVIRELFAVPFEGRLGEPCRKVWAVTEHRNESAMAMLTRLGMRREATLPDYFARRSHAVAFGLTSRGWRAGPFGRKEA